MNPNMEILWHIICGFDGSSIGQSVIFYYQFVPTKNRESIELLITSSIEGFLGLAV